MKKILIMMTDAGGGHRASAEALRDAFEEQYGTTFQIEIVDMWTEHTRFLLNRVPSLYGLMVRRTPRLYRLIFKSTEKPEVIRRVLYAFYLWVRTPVERALRYYRPDLIISVHPLMQDIPLRILGRMRWDIPFVTVITDLATIHPGWLYKDVTLCFVPTEQVYRQAREAGLQPEQVRQYGLPIRPAFARTFQPKETLRQQLGMHPDLPAVLLVGGGEGMGPVGPIARAVAAGLAGKGSGNGTPLGQMVVICGRNEKVRAELEGYPWGIPTRINGFVHNMPEWMSACDCIITKAGPGTIAEAMAMGLPMILSGYVAGQEEGNVPYVVENGAGLYSEDPDEIAAIVRRWFGEKPEERQRMAARSSELGRPRATYQIVEEIAGLLTTIPAGRTKCQPQTSPILPISWS